MISKFFSKPAFIFISFLFFVSLTLSFIIILILINKKVLIDSSSFDFMQMLVRSSFTLIGAAISAGIALLIFTLQQNRIEYDKNELQDLYIAKIKDEHSNNLEVLKNLEEAIAPFENPPLAKMLLMTKQEEKNELKEFILIYYTQLDFSMFDSLFKDIRITDKDNIMLLTDVRKLKLINKYLKLILEEVTQVDPLEKLLSLLKDDLAQIPNPPSSPS
ncbi:hypothetical protein M3221_13790 [Domibacillus indicus]|uniref:hypothetical protein n=1 Tax=Domibacillus indicus TaxID=1437523 RepID=UPI00203C4E82|nr:hypothetical protein [Domibacillus indicus]MCM3789473.1 hypothetical protein [Domibacillus indicus]